MNHPENDQHVDLSDVLDRDGSLASSWLRGKSVTPVPVGPHMDAALTRRVAAGCRAVGASHVVCANLPSGSSQTATTTLRLPIDSGHDAITPPSVMYTPDRQGVVLFREAGYALIAGSDSFMAAAVREGVDTARARFGRHARKLSACHPTLTTVSAAYPSARGAWSDPADVPLGSAAAQLLALLDKFVGGTCSAPEFAHGWWEARRASRANGERIQGPLADLFDRVFMTLEDYSVDPELWEPGELTDSELKTAIQEIGNTFHHPKEDSN
ncbi:colicin immunity domain-containing protein [Streptomyces akebiae]|uniref:Colicin D immunity protein domain-containing protein n=1 Tax=Streptomyces akebiae TaxID=2865673 RepID=A0ABX8XQD7_9ACTN|nr:colicin immunity domain-containing protein [Streptomyces akebiae]QYX77778.1 hypothetical protein K1J60_15675 [Streptomyces akebiae]